MPGRLGTSRAGMPGRQRDEGPPEKTGSGTAGGAGLDELLARGYERWEAREQVEKAVLQVLTEWEGAFNSQA